MFIFKLTQGPKLSWYHTFEIEENREHLIKMLISFTISLLEDSEFNNKI